MVNLLACQVKSFTAVLLDFDQYVHFTLIQMMGI